MNVLEKELKRAVRPMLLTCWNSNHNEKAYDVKLSFAYFPDDYDGGNPPRIRYDIILENGRVQDRHHCSKTFVDLMDGITKRMYERLLGLNSEC